MLLFMKTTAEFIDNYISFTQIIKTIIQRTENVYE